jgi:hypothetical protein
MAIEIRSAAEGNIETIAALGLEDAKKRQNFDSRLWPFLSDGASKIEAALRREISGGPLAWLVAEENGAIVAAARYAVIPCPPIYDLKGGLAGVMLDDTYFLGTASGAALNALLSAMEAIMREKGATIFIAAAPDADMQKRGALEDKCYRPVTRYLVKHDLNVAEPSRVRPASQKDIPGIAALGMQAVAQHARSNPRMWTPHADATDRFSFWMAQSLSMADRSIFVTGAPETLSGFIVVQPAGPFQIPLSGNAALGLIDDFSCDDFQPPAEDAAALLTAAESDFWKRGKKSAMVVCPVAWTDKQSFLVNRGYGPGNLWLLKD